MEIERIKPGKWNSRACAHGGLVFLSGIVADDKTAPMKSQTEQVLAKIDAILAEAGIDKTRLLSATVYLADLDQKDEFNNAWMSWMDPAHPPARVTVGVTLTPGTLVEIMVTAAR